MYSQCMKTARQVKEVFPGCLLVAGGPHASIRPEDVLEEAAFDLAVAGEGEEALVQLVDALSRGGGFDEVTGLVQRKAGALVVSPRLTAGWRRTNCPCPRGTWST